MPLPTRTRLMLSCIRPCFGSSRLSRASLCLPFAVCLFPSLSSFTSIRGRDCGFWRLPFPVTSFLHGGSKPLIPVDSGERLRGISSFFRCTPATVFEGQLQSISSCNANISIKHALIVIWVMIGSANRVVEGVLVTNFRLCTRPTMFEGQFPLPHRFDANLNIKPALIGIFDMIGSANRVDVPWTLFPAASVYLWFAPGSRLQAPGSRLQAPGTK